MRCQTSRDSHWHKPLRMFSWRLGKSSELLLSRMWETVSRQRRMTTRFRPRRRRSKRRIASCSLQKLPAILPLAHQQSQGKSCGSLFQCQWSCYPSVSRHKRFRSRFRPGQARDHFQTGMVARARTGRQCFAKFLRLVSDGIRRIGDLSKSMAAHK